MAELILKINVTDEERAAIEKRFQDEDELVCAAQTVQLSPEEEQAVQRLLLKSEVGRGE